MKQPVHSSIVPLLEIVPRVVLYAHVPCVLLGISRRFGKNRLVRCSTPVCNIIFKSTCEIHVLIHQILESTMRFVALYVSIPNIHDLDMATTVHNRS